MASILGVVDVRDFPAIDPEMTFTPRGDIDFQLCLANRCVELLRGGALAYGKLIVGFPVDLVQSPATTDGLFESEAPDQTTEKLTEIFYSVDLTASQKLKQVLRRSCCYSTASVATNMTFSVWRRTLISDF